MFLKTNHRMLFSLPQEFALCHKCLEMFPIQQELSFLIFVLNCGTVQEFAVIMLKLKPRFYQPLRNQDFKKMQINLQSED